MNSNDRTAPPQPKPDWLVPILSRPRQLSALAVTAIVYWLVCFAPYQWVVPVSYTLNDARIVTSTESNPAQVLFNGMAVVVHLLRPTSNPNGVPEYRGDGFFQGCEPRDLYLLLREGALQLLSSANLLLDIAARGTERVRETVEATT